MGIGKDIRVRGGYEGKRERERRSRREREREGTDRSACLGKGRLGLGGACLLKGQGTQVTGQASRIIIVACLSLQKAGMKVTCHHV